MLGAYIVGLGHGGALHGDGQTARVLGIDHIGAIDKLCPLDARIEVIHEVELIAAIGRIRKPGGSHVYLAGLYRRQDHGEVLLQGLEFQTQHPGYGAGKVELYALQISVGVLELKRGIGRVRSRRQHAVIVVVHRGDLGNLAGLWFLPALWSRILLVDHARAQGEYARHNDSREWSMINRPGH